MAYIGKRPHDADVQERRQHRNRAEWYRDLAVPYQQWARANGIDEREVAKQLQKIEDLGSMHEAAADR